MAVNILTTFYKKFLFHIKKQEKNKDLKKHFIIDNFLILLKTNKFYLFLHKSLLIVFLSTYQKGPFFFYLKPGFQ